MNELIEAILAEEMDHSIRTSSKIRDFLAHMKAEGKLVPSDLKGRQVNQISMWNNYLQEDCAKWAEDFALELLGLWVYFTGYKLKYGRGEDPAEIIANVRTLLETGTVPEDIIWLPGVNQTDLVTGDKGVVALKNWKPVFYVCDNESFKYTEAKSIEPLAPVTVSFSAPSGRLLFTDFFRINDFSDRTDPPDEEQYGRMSLNIEVGRQLQTGHYAEKHNIGYYQTTNTCVAVMRKDNDIIVIERWNDNDHEDVDSEEEYCDIPKISGWEYLGYFSCDMWRVMVADMQQLGDIMEDQKIVPAYLSSGKSYSDNIVQVSVPAGSTITMTSGSNFNKMIDRDALGIPAHIHVWGHYQIEI